MRIAVWVPIVALAAACSETKLSSDVDLGLADGDHSALGDDDDDLTEPSTHETGWVWTTGDTEDTDTVGTGTGTGGTGTGTGTGGTGTGTGGTGTDTGVTTPPTGDELCELAAQSGLATYLDPLQTAGDGRVVYCHSSAGNNWIYNESDISSCLPHLNHNFDIFPTTGCDT